jgi:hypothetical protein
MMNLNPLLNDIHRDEMLRQAENRRRRTRLLCDAAASRRDQRQPRLVLRVVRFQKRTPRPCTTAAAPAAQIG